MLLSANLPKHNDSLVCNQPSENPSPSIVFDGIQFIPILLQQIIFGIKIEISSFCDEQFIQQDDNLRNQVMVFIRQELLFGNV